MDFSRALKYTIIEAIIDPYEIKIHKQCYSKSFLKKTILLEFIDFQDFPGPALIFQDFPVLENAIMRFQDFLGFPGPVRTLQEAFHPDDSQNAGVKQEDKRRVDKAVNNRV